MEIVLPSPQTDGMLHNLAHRCVWHLSNSPPPLPSAALGNQPARSDTMTELPSTLSGQRLDTSISLATAYEAFLHVEMPPLVNSHALPTSVPAGLGTPPGSWPLDCLRHLAVTCKGPSWPVQSQMDRAHWASSRLLTGGRLMTT